MNLIPTEDRVIIEISPIKKETESGFIIPNATKQKAQLGVVVAIGEGTNGKPMICKIGYFALFPNNAGTLIVHQGKEYLVIKQSEIFAFYK